jgi:hypothetical protein
MSSRRLAPLALVLALAGCKTSPKGDRAAADAASDRAAAASPDGGAAMPALGREREERWFRIDALLMDWDATQQDGKDQEAAVLAAKLQQDVDADFNGLAEAAAGKYGVRGEHLGIKALAFSKRPEATEILVTALRSRDQALVGNALIGLKLRADPATSLPPIVALLRAPFTEARRYAPLALANIVLARERVGRPIEEVTAEQAMTGLVGLVQDRDPFARLHAAKCMGALRRPEATDFLVLLLRDEHVRIRLAAAAALERIGDPRAFAQVVRLVDAVPEEQKTVVRDVLASYAERLQGRPLAPGQAVAFGVSPTAWDRWYVDNVTRNAPAPGPR